MTMSTNRPCSRLKSHSHADIVDSFCENYRGKLEDELNWFRDANDLHLAIMKASESVVPNVKGQLKRHSHQRRLKKGVIESATSALLGKAHRFERAKAFNDIFVSVKGAIGGQPGVGPLYVYDVALRIGAHLDIYPDKVYLHAGALKGAIRIFPRDNLGRTLHKDAFPKEYQGLTSYEIENLLCLFHDCIA